MIKLPDFKKAFEYENSFYLTCDVSRISRFVAHYELFKLCQKIPGQIVECGVFKGTSFIRFASFRELFENARARQIIAFDTFGKFPKTNYSEDIKFRKRFLKNAGEDSLSKKQLLKILKQKKLEKNIELVEGNIMKTVPEYVKKHPELKISILNLDVDIYEPASTVLEYLYPKISKGGILILDEYATFPGETKLVDELVKEKKFKAEKFPFSMIPCYIIKQ